MQSVRPLHPFDELPMPKLSMEERVKILAALEPLVKYLGSPGDWGYSTKLGILTIKLLEVRQQLMMEDSTE